MQVRRSVRQLLVNGIGEDRTARAGRVERRVRERVAAAIAPSGPGGPVGRRGPGGARAGHTVPVGQRRTAYGPSDPFLDFPAPTRSRHDLLRHLHRELEPRTYFEVGVADGASMALSRSRSVGVDPAYEVSKPLRCDVHLVRRESDAFFARADRFAHFEDTPIDLAFIDGLHLSDFALRDFMNTEKAMSRAGVVVIDDVMPRNPLEAARERTTFAWAGDVYKVVTILLEQRPDLTIIPVNTRPTGTVVVLGLDPDSRVLEDNYEANLRRCESPDPQSPPEWIMRRQSPVRPAEDVLGLPWASLRALREETDPAALRAALARFAAGSGG